MTYVFYNDLAYWPYYLGYMLCGLLIIIGSIITHELGHLLYFKLTLNKEVKLKIFRKGYQFKIYAGEQSDYALLTNSQYRHVNLFGIIFGLFPISIASLVWTPYFFLIIPYFFGCRKDIYEFLKNLSPDLEDN